MYVCMTGSLYYTSIKFLKKKEKRRETQRGDLQVKTRRADGQVTEGTRTRVGLPHATERLGLPGGGGGRSFF